MTKPFKKYPKNLRADDYEPSKIIISAGAIIVRWDRTRFLYLLLRAHNFWDFPKGQTEENETPFEACNREVEEESTITMLDYKWGHDFYETAPYFRAKKIARYYLAETKMRKISLPINPELGFPEHNAWRWVIRKQALKMVTPRVQAAILWSDNYLAHDQRIKQTEEVRVQRNKLYNRS